MAELPQQFLEDRAMRDAALAVLKADVTHARVSLSGKGLATRITSRVGDGAKDVLEVAKVQAEDNRGILALLIGAVVLWFAREPIFEAFSGEAAQDDSDASSAEAETDNDDLTPGDDNE